MVAPLATALGISLGVLLGLVTGYCRGIIDDVVGRVIDALLALPLVIIALLALTALGASTMSVIIVIGIIFAPLVARTVRAAVLSERDLDYVAAARLRNEHTLYILFAEILPNVMPPIVVEASVRLGYAIFTVATLSFIGFGIQPPSPDWGLAVSESYGLINGGIWWPVLFNTLAIATLVIGVNLAADGIQAAVAA
jgi:peptide/nickel transport system permease protein